MAQLRARPATASTSGWLPDLTGINKHQVYGKHARRSQIRGWRARRAVATQGLIPANV